MEANTTGGGSREARRRRILDRGSDRLALITGRIQTLPSPPEPSDSLQSQAIASPPSISHHRDLPTTVSLQSEDEASSSLLPKQDSGKETGHEASTGNTPEISHNTRSHLNSSNPSASTSTVDPQSERQINGHKIFTSNRINSAIAASENARFACSLAVAFFVILAYVGFPIFGNPLIKKLLVFRPLYLVLLTNVSIVIAHLLLDKQRDLQKNEQETSTLSSLVGMFGLAEQLGKALELGLVWKKVMGAAFIDCGVYAVVLVCGLSVVQRLGW